MKYIFFIITALLVLTLVFLLFSCSASKKQIFLDIYDATWWVTNNMPTSNDIDIKIKQIADEKENAYKAIAKKYGITVEQLKQIEREAPNEWRADAFVLEKLKPNKNKPY
jgi:hypothetical protein